MAYLINPYRSNACEAHEISSAKKPQAIGQEDA